MNNNNEFFQKAFEGYNVPLSIRMASEEICQEFNITGICDPMYISNVIAKELGIGDGCHHFNDNSPSLEKIEHLSQRLKGSYGCNIDDAAKVEDFIRKYIN